MSSSALPELCFMSARELAALVQTRQISARDVMQAHLDRIARINPRVNAIVSKLQDEACLALTDDADRRLARGDAVGPLHGLPIAFKDNQPVKGFPCARLASSQSARRTSPSSPWAHTPITSFSAQPEIPTTSQRVQVGRAAAPPWRWPQACCPSPTAMTLAAHCATQPISITSSRCV